MLFSKITAISAITLLASQAFAVGEVCQTLWAEHQSEYTEYVKNAQPDMLKKAQDRLDKSIVGHEAWLKGIYSKIDSDPEVRTNMIGIKEKTSQLRKTFDAFSVKEKAVLFSSKKRLEHLTAARDADELFEESLSQEYFGVRNSEEKSKEGVYKYISSIEDMNWALVQPLYKMLKTKARSEKG